jgi:hypothetical protein
MPKKKSTTNFNVDKLPKLVNSLADIMQDSLPRSIYGLLSTAEEKGNSIVIGKRWMISPVAKANYNIIDDTTGTVLHEGVARLQTAISIINLLNKNPYANITKIKVLESIDKSYLRCLTDIYLYKLQIKNTADLDKKDMIQYRLDDKLYKLSEIKQQLFKLYC